MDPDRNEDRKPAKTRERSRDSKVGCFGFLTDTRQHGFYLFNQIEAFLIER